MSSAVFSTWSAQALARVEAALDQWVPADAPAGLGQAMRYGVLDGGKRLRALLILAAAEAAGADRVAGGTEAAMRAACAMEMIHAYSLVHDDMPCMDNDVLRRGKPTVHVQFGQAQALLAGDALQTLAFEVLTPDAPADGAGSGAGVDGCLQTRVQARLCGLLARAAGPFGMAGGQAIDLASVGKALDEATLRDMHHRKTGALLLGSVQMGAACGGLEPGSVAWQALSDFGDAIGLAFQIVDDVLDATQASDKLGKTAGKDADANKPTYVSLLGLERAQAESAQLLSRARQALVRSELGEGATAMLAALAERIVHRDH
ncbi:MAG: polyprenyl synthetase family protein [Burkholderiales bacterium]|nr:polyprenyl synthetase family protein [Burkholderiales bacterium]